MVTKNSQITIADLSQLNSKILDCLQSAQYSEAERLSTWVIDSLQNNSTTLLSHSHLFEPYFYLGVALQYQGKIKLAMANFHLALELNPQHLSAMQAIASCLDQLSRYEECELQLLQALDIAPNDPIVNANLGAISEKLSKSDEALVYYQRALHLQPRNYTALLNCTSLLINMSRRGDALRHARIAYEMLPQSLGMLYNLVDALLNMFNYKEALAYCDIGLAREPKHALLVFKKGLILSCLKKYKEAHSCLASAQILDPKVISNVSSKLNKLAVGTDVYLNPTTLYLDAMYQAQFRCFWRDRNEFVSEWELLISDENYTINNIDFAFQTIALPINGQDRLKLARNIAEWHAEMAWLEGSEPFNYLHNSNGVLRVGYISADFRTHPVGLLTQQLYKLHDSANFEIYLYSLFNGLADDKVTEYIKSSNDNFNDVSNKTDKEIANLIYQHKIDILIDLTGYTANGRHKVMAMRPAPIQVAYLGFPGTSGADYIDYAIVDHIIGFKPYDWSEKLVRMPHAFSPYDNRIPNSLIPDAFNKEKYGLPKKGIIFCCFNLNYKIGPEIFSIWMRVLAKVPDSVLWLIGGNAEIELNLKEAANAQQIEPERLIFAPHVTFKDHIFRYQLADLFLDTDWHNAHTTAADALWQGLPVITCPGEVISSRLAASLLNALEMPELIAKNFTDYQEKAIYYATHPDALLELKQKLKVKKSSTPLFDTSLTVKHLEKAYQMMWQRYQDGLPPETFNVPDLRVTH